MGAPGFDFETWECTALNHAASTSLTVTLCPRAAAMLTRASSEKRAMRPWRRSLMRGRVTPQRAAASTWAQPLRATRRAFCCNSVERSRRLAASSGVSASASQTLAYDLTLALLIEDLASARRSEE